MPGIGFSERHYSVGEQEDLILEKLNQPGCPIQILSVWGVDQPNHGDAAILNADALERFHYEYFTSPDHAAAVTAFLSSGLLSPFERNNLVGIAHSSGTAGLLGALPASGKLPTIKYFLAHAKQPESWSTVDEAMRYMRSTFPWKHFDEANLQIIAKTFFTPVDPSTNASPVKTKTSFKQQMVVWADVETAYSDSDRLRALVDQIPCHLIQGARHDPGIWYSIHFFVLPKQTFDEILSQIEQIRPKLASVTTIEGVGHCVPHGNPYATAATIVKALGDARYWQLPSRM
ncbi:hypothetical protein C8J56DRAFT_888286 [Mycena floridula]|nr:hypothetical protein C8J56DRAFT_888286 [Mycena floridula]